MTFVAACRDELAQIFRRQHKIAFLLFAVPLLCSLGFGSVYGGNLLKEIPTAIYDQDQTATSRALVQAVADNERFAVRYQVDSQEELEYLLHENKALAAVTIPPHFARDIKHGLRSQVMISANGANLMFASAASSSGQEVVQTFAGGLAARLLEGGGQLPGAALKTAAPLRFALRLPNNPTTAYNYFMLAGLAANVLQLGIMLAVCGVMIRQRGLACEGFFALLGRLFSYWCCSLLSFALCVAALVLAFGVPCRAPLWQFLFLAAAFCAAMIATGIFFSALARDEVTAVQLPMLYIMPAFLFSGYSWPMFAMTGFGKTFSALTPIHYAAENLRDLMLSGYAPALAWDSAILILFTVVFGAAAWLLHRFRIQREVVA